MIIEPEEPRPPGPAEPDRFGRRVGRAMRWSFANQAMNRLMTLARGIVLARLLIPEELGSYGLALAIVTVVLGFNDLGLTQAVVVDPRSMDRTAPSAYALTLFSSTVLFTALVVSAPWLTGLLNSHESSGVLRLLALVVLIDALVNVQATEMRRELLQHRQTLIETAGFLISIPLTLVLAARGWGEWALAIGQVVGAATTAALLLVAVRRRIRPRFERVIVRELLRFGLPLALTNIVESVLTNVDYLIVAVMLDPIALGFYVFAFNLSSWTVNIFSGAMSSVTVAGFARLTDDRERMSGAFVYTLGLALLLVSPIVVMLAVLAREVVDVVYGTRWAPSVTALQYLTVLGGLRVIVMIVIDFLVSDSRNRAALAVNGIWLVALVPALAFGAASDGIEGVGLAQVVVAALVTLPVALLVVRASGIRVASLPAVVIRPLVGMIAGGAAALVVERNITNDVASLLVAGTAGVLVYLAIVVPRNAVLQWGIERVRPRESG